MNLQCLNENWMNDQSSTELELKTVFAIERPWESYPRGGEGKVAINTAECTILDNLFHIVSQRSYIIQNLC